MYDPGDMPAGIMDAPGDPVPLNVRRMQRSKNLSGMTVEQKQIMALVCVFSNLQVVSWGLLIWFPHVADASGMHFGGSSMWRLIKIFA